MILSLNLLSLIGNTLFAVSSIPTAYKSLKTGKTEFIPLITQWCVLIGSISMYVYLALRNGFDWIIFFDYFVTILSWSIVMFYSYFPRKQTKGEV